MTGADLLIQQGEVRTLLYQMTRKFGAVSDSLRARVAQLSPNQLEELMGAVLDLTDFASLEAWLEERVPTRN